MVRRGQKTSTHIRTVCNSRINEAGFSYIEVLVTFSLTMFILTTVLFVGRVIIDESRLSGDELIIHREASAFHFLLLNEIKRGYHFRVVHGALHFKVSPVEEIKILHDGHQLVRQYSENGGSYSGYVIIGRYVDSAQFLKDPYQDGVTIRMTFSKGEARLPLETYFHSRTALGEELYEE